ncbi:glutamine-fructose-6-phosphate aminotransferase [isomerizing] [Enterococcus avium]|nr:glutamine-fructose-6-phosphate aminotransferase [isomerizing] [Enterococcus avium]
MCGIVGIIGNEETTEILVRGLEKLEYRGYDSAGIYVKEDEKAFLVKAQGRIAELKAKIKPEVQGVMGIGHTRWATHGEPSEANAHPHMSGDQRFVLVHNGVIENYEEVRQGYLSEHLFLGETDTEIVVHLIEEFASQGLSTEQAFKKAIEVIEGSYAFALIDTEDSEHIYVAKNKSPLLIGVGEGFNVICSDAMAMLEQTSEFVEIEDGELVIVCSDRIEIFDAAGNQIERQSFQAQLDVEDIEKGPYPYYMLKEIEEQPLVIRRLLETYTKEKTIELDQRCVEEFLTADRIYIVACGTSYHAGWAGQRIIEELSGIPVEVHLSSEFAYNTPLLSKKPFFIFLSQSGETADSRQVLVKVNGLGHPALTITNVPGSTLSREADYTLLLHAGPEIAVASTKAYTAQIAMMTLLAAKAGKEKGLESALAFDTTHELSLVASAMESILTDKENIHQLVKEYLAETRNAFYIGRGMDYFVAMEAALKLKEISYIQAEGFASGELKHGTISLIEENTPVIAVITEKNTGAHTRGNVREVESRGAKAFVIAMESVAKETDQVVLPNVHPLLTALSSIVFCHLIAYFATIDRGYDADKPRNLAKSVTVE